MRICLLHEDFPPIAQGGAAAVVQALAQGYMRRGHEVTVITAVQTKSLAGSFSEQGLSIERIYSNYPVWLRAWRSLYNPTTLPTIKKILASLQPDVVHVHNVHYHLSYHSIKLAKQSGARVLFTAHDCMLFHYGKFTEYIDPQDISIPKTFNYKSSPWGQFLTYKKRYNPFRNVIIRHYLKYCDKICAVSYALQAALTANGISHTDVVHNGLDVAQWETWKQSESRLKVIKDLGHSPVIGFVGKLSTMKGVVPMLRALAEVRKQLPETVLLAIGGADSYTKDLQPLASRLGVASSIICTEKLEGEQLVAAYKACTVVAFPSVCLDTFGMVNIEAMATGKPVVATCFGGSPEIVVDGVTGTIVNPYDSRVFSSALLEFLNDADKSERFGRAGSTRVETAFTLDRQIDRYIELMHN